MKVTILLICGTVYNATNLTPVQGAGTHQAWLNSDVNSGIRDIFTSQVIKGRRKCNDFSMSSGILQFFYLVVSPCNDLIIDNHNSTNWYFIFIKCFLCLQQCLPHEVFIISVNHYLFQVLI